MGSGVLQPTLDALDRDARATSGLPLPRADRRPVVGTDATVIYYVGKDGIVVGAVWSSLLEGPARELRFIEDVQEFMQEFNGLSSWPECPSHPASHPLRAGTDVDDVLVWECPKEGAVIARVGDLQGPAGR